MFRLMRLELKKNNIRLYTIYAAIIGIVMLAFIYLFAFAPQIEPNDEDMKLFANYNNIVILNSILTTCAFSVLASSLHCKFILEEYIGKKATIIFTYPIDRVKVCLAKVLVVSIFTVAAMSVCNIGGFTIFFITENIEPLKLGTEIATFSIYARCIIVTLFMSILAVAISGIAIAIGFWRKSVATTIIVAVLIDSLMSNCIVSALENINMIQTFTIVFVVIAVIAIKLLLFNIKNMEVE